MPLAFGVAEILMIPPGAVIKLPTGRAVPLEASKFTVALLTTKSPAVPGVPCEVVSAKVPPKTRVAPE